MRRSSYLTWLIFFLLTETLYCQNQANHSAVLMLDFDSGSSVSTTSTSGYTDYRQGVSGLGVFLDGYTSKILHTPLTSTDFSQGFTISAWIALQTYPWNCSAIINQGTIPETLPNDSVGYDFLLGINTDGSISFKVNTENQLMEIVTYNKISLHDWNHIAASYVPGEGMSIYLNGELIERKKAQGKLPLFTGQQLWIGKNLERMGALGSERKASFELGSDMVIHGLLDEIQIFNEPLPAQEIKEKYIRLVPKEKKALSYYRLPTPVSHQSPKFKAYYTRLNYSPEWEHAWRVGDHQDIVVEFDNLPAKYVFWRGTGYGGVWISENGIWMADQSLERAGKGKSPLGCSEHMSDKQTRFGQVKILENTDARIVIHWRYAISDIQYNIFGAESDTDWGEWAEEYYYIYPDGIATRYQTLWSDHLSHEWQETIVINQPGTKPEDNIELNALSLANEKGETKTFSWKEGAPKSYRSLEDINIQMVNIKSDYKPFIIFEKGVSIKPFKGNIRPAYSKFPWWNHWPVAQIPNDGRKAFAADRPSHSSLSQAIENSGVIKDNQDGSFAAVSLTGMTNNAIISLIPISRSWNHAPEAVAYTQNIDSIRFVKYEKAYHVFMNTDATENIDFKINATKEQPLVNPVFVINNSDKTEYNILANSEELHHGTGYRFGQNSLLSGNRLVIWINGVYTDQVRFSFIEN